MAEASDAKTTKVSVGYPDDYFEHGVNGVPDPLTREPQEVPNGKLKQLRDVARASGIYLKESSA